MAVHDTIGDFLTTIRNGSAAHKRLSITPYSKLRLQLAQILKEEGYLADVKTSKDERGMQSIELHYKYVGTTPAIAGIERHSSPGRRLYYGYRDIPRVLGGLGVAILTTSKGVMRARDARAEGVGGELICKVW
jgi:small subunit ribosomal protein S8